MTKEELLKDIGDIYDAVESAIPDAEQVVTELKNIRKKLDNLPQEASEIDDSGKDEEEDGE